MSDHRGVLLQAVAAMSCEHDWRRVAPVVVVVNDPLAREKGGTTYNAECQRCSKREWIHWPPVRYERSA